MKIISSVSEITKWCFYIKPWIKFHRNCLSQHFIEIPECSFFVWQIDTHFFYNKSTGYESHVQYLCCTSADFYFPCLFLSSNQFVANKTISCRLLLTSLLSFVSFWSYRFKFPSMRASCALELVVQWCISCLWHSFATIFSEKKLSQIQFIAQLILRGCENGRRRLFCPQWNSLNPPNIKKYC